MLGIASLLHLTLSGERLSIYLLGGGAHVLAFLSSGEPPCLAFLPHPFKDSQDHHSQDRENSRGDPRTPVTALSFFATNTTPPI